MSWFRRRTILLTSLVLSILCLVILGLSIGFIVSWTHLEYKHRLKWYCGKILGFLPLDALSLYNRCVGLRFVLRFRTGSNSVLYRFRTVRSRSTFKRNGTGQYGQLDWKLYCWPHFSYYGYLSRSYLIFHLCCHCDWFVYICQVSIVFARFWVVIIEEFVGFIFRKRKVETLAKFSIW